VKAAFLPQQAERNAELARKNKTVLPRKPVIISFELKAARTRRFSPTRKFNEYFGRCSPVSRVRDGGDLVSS
jgi:hypothetical protein